MVSTAGLDNSWINASDDEDDMYLGTAVDTHGELQNSVVEKMAPTPPLSPTKAVDRYDEIFAFPPVAPFAPKPTFSIGKRRECPVERPRRKPSVAPSVPTFGGAPETSLAADIRSSALSMTRVVPSPVGPPTEVFSQPLAPLRTIQATPVDEDTSSESSIDSEDAQGSYEPMDQQRDDALTIAILLSVNMAPVAKRAFRARANTLIEQHHRAIVCQLTTSSHAKIYGESLTLLPHALYATYILCDTEYPRRLRLGLLVGALVSGMLAYTVWCL